jgi:hypothetical protein
MVKYERYSGKEFLLQLLLFHIYVKIEYNGTRNLISESLHLIFVTVCTEAKRINLCLPLPHLDGWEIEGYQIERNITKSHVYTWN